MLKKQINISFHFKRNKHLSKRYSKFIHILLIIFLIQFYLLSYDYIETKENPRLLYNNYLSEVHLVIRGNGTQNILFNEFRYEPDEVLVNGISKGNTCKKTCELEKEENNITLIFSETLYSSENMFYGLQNIKEIDLSRFDSSKIRNMSQMFYNCSNLENIIFGNIDTSSVQSMNYLFGYCSKLTSINLSHFNTSSLEYLGYMFRNCSNIKEIDISSFDTSKVKTMKSMFHSCKNLRNVNFGEINTSSVTSLKALFYRCENILSVDLTHLDTSLITDIIGIFFHCYKLKNILFPERFITSKITTLYSAFNQCRSLISLNFTNSDTSKVTSIEYAFYNCENLKYLDLSNLILKNITSLEGAFYNCKNLIYLNFKNMTVYENAIFKNSLTLLTSNTKFCLIDVYTQNYLLNVYGFISNCSDICFQKNIKLDIVLNECIETCQEHNYEYECNNICYHSCPENSYASVNTPFICYDRNPIGYYLDSSESIYKECYRSCKYCYGPGDDSNHNCKKCKSGFTNLNNDNNCYLVCDYYFYIDEYNNYQCTLNEECPDNYNKLVLDNKQCIDECKRIININMNIRILVMKIVQLELP